MKCQLGSTGAKPDFRGFIDDIISDLFSNRLSIEGQSVVIPDRDDLNLGVKYCEDETECTLTFKIDWSNNTEVVEVSEEVSPRSKKTAVAPIAPMTYIENGTDEYRIKSIWMPGYTGHSESYNKTLRKFQ